MANNDRLEELLEESIRAQNRINFAIQGVAVFVLTTPLISALFWVVIFVVDESVVGRGAKDFMVYLGTFFAVMVYGMALYYIGKAQVKPRVQDYVDDEDTQIGERDLTIAKYFSTEEIKAWEQYGKPALEDWVDAGRPPLKKWLEGQN